MKLLPNTYSTPEKALLFLCLIIWCKDSLVNTFWILLNRYLHIPYDFTQNYLMPMLIVILIVVSFSAIIERVNHLQIGLYILFCLLFYVSYYFHPDNPGLSGILGTYPFSILSFLFIGSLFNINVLKKALVIISFLAIAKDSMFLFVFRDNSSRELIEGGEYITAAYTLLPHVLILIWYTFEHPKLYNIIIIIYSFFILLSYGNRGSGVCVLVFIVLYLISQRMKSMKSRDFLSLLLILYIVYLLLNEILVFVQGLLIKIGLSSRVFDLVLETEFGSDESTQNRLYYYSKGLKALDSNDLGLGMAGDRIPLHGGYSHNIIVESIVSYGYLFGTLFLLMVFGLIVWAFKKAQNKNDQVFLILLICIGLLPLFMSGSYVSSERFYFLLGFCTYLITSPKQKMKLKMSVYNSHA